MFKGGKAFREAVRIAGGKTRGGAKFPLKGGNRTGPSLRVKHDSLSHPWRTCIVSTESFEIAGKDRQGGKARGPRILALHYLLCTISPPLARKTEISFRSSGRPSSTNGPSSREASAMLASVIGNALGRCVNLERFDFKEAFHSEILSAEIHHNRENNSRPLCKSAGRQ